MSLMWGGSDSWGHPAMRVPAAHLHPCCQVFQPGVGGWGREAGAVGCEAGGLVMGSL